MSLSGRKPESQGELGAESEKQGSRARLRGEEESEPEMASCKKKKKIFFRQNRLVFGTSYGMVISFLVARIDWVLISA